MCVCVGGGGGGGGSGECIKMEKSQYIILEGNIGVFIVKTYSFVMKPKHKNGKITIYNIRGEHRGVHRKDLLLCDETKT